MADDASSQGAYDRRVIELLRAHLILYVGDQARSARFYASVLDMAPTLDVPGMTEFALGEGCVLGLMSSSAITRLLPELPDPASAEAPRAEAYLVVDDPAACHRRSLAAGAAELSPLQERDWGHEAAYSLDRDGHVLAFARPLAGRR